MQADLFLKLLALSPFTLETASNALFINAQPITKLSKNLDCYQTKRGTYLKLQKLTENLYSQFPQKTYDLIFIYPTNSAEENYANYAKALELLNPGGLCLSAGDNNFGGKRFEDKLKLLFNNINSESKYKSRIFWAQKTEDFNTEVYQQWQELLNAKVIPGTQLYTQAGLFSEGKQDLASSLMLPYLNGLSGTVLDLGSGNGYLSAQALKQNPEIISLHLADHDYRAVEPSKLSLNTQSSIPITYSWWDIVEETLPSADFVISNPPYHSGFALDLKLLHDFINYGFKILKKRGKFIFVTQKTFKVENNQEAFKNAKLLFSDASFKIYQLTK